MVAGNGSYAGLYRGTGPVEGELVVEPSTTNAVVMKKRKSIDEDRQRPLESNRGHGEDVQWALTPAATLHGM